MSINHKIYQLNYKIENSKENHLLSFQIYACLMNPFLDVLTSIMLNQQYYAFAYEKSEEFHNPHAIDPLQQEQVIQMEMNKEIQIYPIHYQIISFTIQLHILLDDDQIIWNKMK